jgi:hypothetical protein
LTDLEAALGCRIPIPDPLDALASSPEFPKLDRFQSVV